MTPEQQWLRDYLTALDQRIRPDADDARFLAAAAAAYSRGWTGTDAARRVNAHNYVGATNPRLIAIMRLENVGEPPPAATRTTPGPKVNENGCIVCAPGTYCPDPVLERIPPHWTAERMRLLRELGDIPPADMGGDERAQIMAQLIADQHRREALTGS
jgi:hypothetical protein